MSARHMSKACLNSGKPTPGRCPSPWNSTEPPKKLGSGKLLTPCECMQAVTLRKYCCCKTVIVWLFVPLSVPPAGSKCVQSLSAA